MSLFNIVSILITLANFGLGLFVLLKGIRKRANQFFFLLASATAGWVFSNWMGVYNTNYISALWWWRITFVFASFIAPLFIFFVMNFSQKLAISNIKKTLLLMALVIFSSLSFSNLIIADVIMVPSGYYGEGEMGLLYPIYAIYIITFFIIGFYYLYLQYKKVRGLLRLKIEYVFWGFGISAIIGVFTNLIVPVMEYVLGLPINRDIAVILSDFGPLSTITMVFFISYAIVKYRLMDIKFVLRKGVVHLISLIILMAIYTYLVLVVQRYYNLNQLVTTLIAVIVIVITVYPLRKWLFQNIDLLFYSKEIEESEKVNRLIDRITEINKYEEILIQIKKIIQSSLQIQDVKLLILNRKKREFETSYPKELENKISLGEDSELIKYLQEKKEILVSEEIAYLISSNGLSEIHSLELVRDEIKELKAEVVVPLGVDEIFSLIILGPKEDKQAFTVQDINFLKDLARQISLSLGNAILYKEAVERIKQEV